MCFLALSALSAHPTTKGLGPVPGVDGISFSEADTTSWASLWVDQSVFIRFRLHMHITLCPIDLCGHKCSSSVLNNFLRNPAILFICVYFKKIDKPTKMGDAGELAYIANLLNGDPSQAPQNPAGAPRGRGRGRGRRGGHSGRGRGGSAAPNAGAGPSTAPAPTPADTDTDPLNRPRESSSPKLWHCEACDVLVPRRPGDWEVHVAGIRHRRQVLSLREHGQRGRLVMSVFESAPQPDGGQGSQHRLAGNAASEAAGDDDFRRLMSMGKSVDREIIAPARTAALAQMLGIYGRSWLYDAVSETEFNLKLLSGLGFVMYHSLYAADNQQKMKRLNESSPSPAFLAFVATALRQGALPAPLPPLIVLKMQGGGFVGSVSTAAWLCALIMLLEALTARPSPVTALWIGVRTDPLGGQMDGNVMRDGWARVLIVLRHLLASLVSGLE
jgi:hypothetical protein